MKKIFFILIISIFVSLPSDKIFAHKPVLVWQEKGDIQINNTEISQAFYDELKGEPRDYFINSEKDFNLYINLLVPELTNRDGRYSADIFLLTADEEEKIDSINGTDFEWEEEYEPFGREYYFKGPEIEKQLLAGKYKISVFSEDNLGKYVLVVGKKEVFDLRSVLNVYWQIPLLKIQFFKSDILQFFLTPFGIAGIGIIGGFLIFLALIYYLVGVVRQTIKHNQAKTMLLTSGGMDMKDEIIKFLQKPAYDITVAFITTAGKPEENLDYLKKDWNIMRDEMGFNIEEVDIEGKTEHQVFELLKLKDIIFVEGGNTFYLLNAMRKCNFERIIKKLLKQGKVYIGASAGSIVVGRTIKTADKFGTGNRERFGVKNLKGLNLVPFDIFVHYQPEYAEIIKQKMPNPKKRAKKLKIITDQQAIFVQGKEVDLIGEGEAVII